jgi:hypothetical protein
MPEPTDAPRPALTVEQRKAAAVLKGPWYDVPKGARASECNSRQCRATIFWTVTDTGARMPVDCDVPGGYEPNSDEAGHGVSHFATCADPQRFSGRGKR